MSTSGSRRVGQRGTKNELNWPVDFDDEEHILGSRQEDDYAIIYRITLPTDPIDQLQLVVT